MAPFSPLQYTADNEEFHTMQHQKSKAVTRSVSSGTPNACHQPSSPTPSSLSQLPHNHLPHNHFTASQQQHDYQHYTEAALSSLAVVKRNCPALLLVDLHQYFTNQMDIQGKHEAIHRGNMIESLDADMRDGDELIVASNVHYSSSNQQIQIQNKFIVMDDTLVSASTASSSPSQGNKAPQLVPAVPSASSSSASSSQQQHLNSNINFPSLKSSYSKQYDGEIVVESSSHARNPTVIKHQTLYNVQMHIRPVRSQVWELIDDVDEWFSAPYKFLYRVRIPILNNNPASMDQLEYSTLQQQQNQHEPNVNTVWQFNQFQPKNKLVQKTTTKVRDELTTKNNSGDLQSTGQQGFDLELLLFRASDRQLLPNGIDYKIIEQEQTSTAYIVTFRAQIQTSSFHHSRSSFYIEVRHTRTKELYFRSMAKQVFCRKRTTTPAGTV